MKGSFYNKKKILALILFILSLGILFFTLDDIGVTIDEPYKNRTAAQLFVGWLELTLQDIFQGNWQHFSSQEVIESYFHPPYIYHPPFARMLTGITWRLFHNYMGELKALRLATAILFSLNIALLFILIAEYFNIIGGIVASLSLLFIPATFGHAHLIALDSPIASMWFLTIFCFIKGLEDSRWSIILGIAWGLALNTKIHAYFIPIPLFFWSFLYCRHRFQNNFFAMFFLSPIVLFISNPYIWHDTIYNWFSFLSILVKRKELFSIPTYFLGTTYDYSASWYYPFFMVLITLPPSLLILAFIGAIRSLFRGRKILSSSLWQNNLGMLFLLNAIAPLGLVAMGSAPTYDGVRLFLPAYPFLAALAGIGFYYLEGLVREVWQAKFTRIKALGLCLIFLALPMYHLVHIHPYELSYFNIFIGGIRGAWKAGLETTYWNDPFNPSFVRLLNERFPGKSFRPDMANDINFEYYHELGLLRKDITYSYDDNYDYFLLAFRQGFFDAEAWFYAKYIEPIYKVEIDGVPLLGIYKPLKELARQAIKPKNQNIPGPQGALPPQLAVLTSYPDQPGQWTGLLKAADSGWYWLGVLTKEGVEISINNKSCLQAEASSDGTFKETRLALDKGFHLLKINFIMVNDPTFFYLAWKKPSQERGIVPIRYLSPFGK